MIAGVRHFGDIWGSVSFLRPGPGNDFWMHFDAFVGISMPMGRVLECQSFQIPGSSLVWPHRLLEISRSMKTASECFSDGKAQIDKCSAMQ